MSSFCLVIKDAWLTRIIKQCLLKRVIVWIVLALWLFQKGNCLLKRVIVWIVLTLWPTQKAEGNIQLKFFITHSRLNNQLALPNLWLYLDTRSLILKHPRGHLLDLNAFPSCLSRLLNLLDAPQCCLSILFILLDAPSNMNTPWFPGATASLVSPTSVP